jgi:hypothetical protein
MFSPSVFLMSTQWPNASTNPARLWTPANMRADATVVTYPDNLLAIARVMMRPMSAGRAILIYKGSRFN